MVWEYGEISHHASVLRIGKNPIAPALFAQSVTLSVLSVLIGQSTLRFLATGDVGTSWLAVRVLRSGFYPLSKINVRLWCSWKTHLITQTAPLLHAASDCEHESLSVCFLGLSVLCCVEGFSVVYVSVQHPENWGCPTLHLPTNTTELVSVFVVVVVLAAPQ